MKKVGIVTIIDNENCGNRLQNYAMQEIIKKLGLEAITLRNDKLLNSKENYYKNYLRYIKKKILEYLHQKKSCQFEVFNQYITFSKRLITCKTKHLEEKYDYFIVGSDQVWKPTRKRMSDIDLLKFAPNNKRISYAASFGIDEIDDKAKQKLLEELPKFKAISVREEAGKRIIKEATGLEDVEVVLDPTMLLTKETWEKLENNPFYEEKHNYVLAYFLGDEEKEKIKDYCQEHHLEFIDFYEKDKQYGPMEFLYLIHHAKFVLTDSFHGCVFSIIFQRNFLVFDRKQIAVNNNMNSRLETLLKTFHLESRKVDSFQEITKLNTTNQQEVLVILKQKRQEAITYLKSALDL